MKIRKSIIQYGLRTVLAAAALLPVRAVIAADAHQQATLTSGPSSSMPPHLISQNPGTEIYSILSAGDEVPNTDSPGEMYQMNGVPDGMGAYDNGDGTFTLLVNHELQSNLGIERAHGAKGAYVAEFVVSKTDFSIVSGRDLATSIWTWDKDASGLVQIGEPLPDEPDLRALNRLCSGDLAAPTAFFNSATGRGTRVRIYTNGEEAGPQGRAFAWPLGGSDARKGIHLPHLGRFSWENSVPAPAEQDLTIVAGLDDSNDGELYFYVGTKQDTGSDVEKAGLVGGKLYGLSVPDKPLEVGSDYQHLQTENVALVDLGDVSELDGSALSELGDSLGVTRWGRPEDGVWDPRSGRENYFYWVTTGGRTGGNSTPARLFCLKFDDISKPWLGGEHSIVLDEFGPDPDVVDLDNMTMDEKGIIYIQEDTGGSLRLAKIWAYDTNTGESWEWAQYTPKYFTPESGDYITTNEESSGIIPLDGILGAGWFALNSQVHASVDSETSSSDAERRERFGLSLEEGVEAVELGQLLLINVADATQGFKCIEYLPQGDEWKYSVGSAPEGWEQSDFDDSSWSSGNAELGFGEGDEATVLPGGVDSHFFRNQFTLSNPEKVTALTLHLKSDDGAKVYINGNEVLRKNADNTISAPDDGQTYTEHYVSTSSIRAGVNVIAIEVNQVDPSSNDLSFDAVVQGKVAQGSGSIPAAPTMVAEAISATEIALTWNDPATDEAGFTLEWLNSSGAWQVISGANVPGLLVPDTAAFNVPGLSPGTEYSFRVKAFNIHGNSAFSNIATVQTPADNATTILATDFGDGLGSWSPISLASNADWFAAPDGFAEMNGFGADEPSNDWLISPQVDFNSFDAEVLTFDTIKGFDGPALEALISTDYDGGPAPQDATWTSLGATLSAGDFAQTSSGEIDLSGTLGKGYIAFRYVSTGTGGGDGAIWRVTNVRLNGLATGVAYPFAVPAPPGEILVEVGGQAVVRNGGFGSGMAKSPHDPNVFWLLTDRGPNVNGATPGEKVFPNPDFAPQVGIFRHTEAGLIREGTITLKTQAGFPITGLPNPVGFGGTGETPLDIDGNVLPLDPTGLDPEGIAIAPDGTFWVSDEYGPHIIHFAADGRTIERINPFGLGFGGRTLPKVFANRRANRGMEGIAITPDGQWLVGIMQSAMYNPFEDRTNIRDTSSITRLVMFHIATGETRQYVYLQEEANLSNSEIRALSNTEFVILERDGAFPNNGTAAIKKFYKIDIAGATDVSDPADGPLGVIFDVDGEQKTLEQLPADNLADFGIVPVEKKLMLDLLSAVPDYPHDKPEGFEICDDGVFAIINDDDFSILADGNGGAMQKILPLNGQIDSNVLHFVKLPAFAVDFAAGATQVLSVDPVQFTSNVSGGVGELTYHWDFGDGETSDDANPTHLFEGGGLFSVTLTVTDQDGNEVVSVKSDLVSVTQATDQGIPESIADLRIATYNTSLNRDSAGELISDLRSPDNAQAKQVAEIIQLANPDVVLLNEFDFDPNGEAIELFQTNYLEIGQAGLDPVEYPFVFLAESNTGIASGFDYNNNGETGDPDDAFGFGNHPGQFAMVVLSKFPIDAEKSRTFQKFLWKDMPGALLPDDPDTAVPADWYSADELVTFRLSSKSHWDVVIDAAGKEIHVLASHPTPPVFDGAEDRNGRRNHDEIRFWADYIDPSKSSYIYDDAGVTGGLGSDDLFVIVGDLNADPNDGDSTNNAIDQLLNHPLIDSRFVPSSAGATENNDGGGTQTGDPGEDTASFNLRADYVLHSAAGVRTQRGEVFWPISSDIRYESAIQASDHRMVYLDLDCKPNSHFNLQVIHSSDNESSFQDPNTLEPKILNYAQIIAGLQKLSHVDEIPSIYLTAGDHTLPQPFYEAAAQTPNLGFPGAGDIAFYNEMLLTANGMGNHEFDGGIDEFAKMLHMANYPFLAANLDFSNVQLMPGSPAIEIGEDGASVSENFGKVARSSYVEVGGEKIGLIGRAPADFFNVVADPASTLPGLDFVGGRDPENNQPLVSALSLVLEQVDILKSKGINKIILMDHAQDFTGDPLSAQLLRDIDIIVSAGTTGFMANELGFGPYNLLRSDDEPTTQYPTVRDDSDGNPVLVVNSDQLYKYVGNLIVGFDETGVIDFIDKRSGPIATTAAGVDLVERELGKELVLNPEVRQIWEDLQQTPLIQTQFEVVGVADEPLVGARSEVRSRETNLGRLAADSTLWFAQQFIEANDIDIDDVDIALKNGGGIRDDILGPNVTRFTIGAALAFDNRLAIVELTAKELLATMENAVSRTPSLDGRFPQLAGLYLEFDENRAGVSDRVSMVTPSRIGTLIVHRAGGSTDTVVENFELIGDPNRTFVLATNNFLLTGGDGYRALKAINDDTNRPTFETSTGEQQILASYIQDVLGGEVSIPDNMMDTRISDYSSGDPRADYFAGEFDEASQEIVAYCPVARRLFVSNAFKNRVDVLDASDPDNLVFSHSIAGFDGPVNSVDTHNGVLAVAAENGDKMQPGFVFFFDTVQTNELNRVQVGVLPDMVTFSPDGRWVITANEGEPNDDYTIDPEGSVSIINVEDSSYASIVNLGSSSVRTLGFGAFDLLPFMRDLLNENNIRIFGEIQDENGDFLRYSTIAEDLEPEYVAVSADSKTAYITLQENNALAILDIEAGEFKDIVSFGLKDHSQPGNGLDPSNRDGGINIANWPVFGMYMPDAIATFQADGQEFLITANEGDARDYDGFSEEERIAELTLDPDVFPNAEELQDDAALGRLNSTTSTGDLDGDGDVDQLVSYGARSFSIWDTKGNLVFDSGDQLEQIVAERYPGFFNVSNSNNDFDNRSDDKGPEPEGVAIGEIDDRTYAFVGLERFSSVVIYDVTFPYNPVFVDMILNRDFTQDPEDDAEFAGDIGPEGLLFLTADESPTGNPALAVAFEVSGSTTIFDINIPPTAGFQLQITHSSDNESAFQDINTGEEKVLGYSAVVDGLRTLAHRERMGSIHLTAGDHTLPGPFYQASAEVDEFGKRGLADIAIYNAMGLTANGIGNHEFDGGINDFAAMLATADYPFLSVNLDFSNAVLEEGTPAIEIGVDGASVEENAGKIAKSSYVIVNGQKIGLIGRSPADFFNVIADPDTTMPGIDFVGGRNPDDNQPLVSAVGQVLEQVELLESKGINKIILLDHAQDFTGDPLSAQSLRGIDIIVAAGSTGFMGNEPAHGPFNLLRAGDTPQAAYPTVREDSRGDTVLVVNSDQLYTYVGNLMVAFDAEGKILSVDGRSGPIASTTEAANLLAAEIGVSVEPNAEVARIWNLLQETDLIKDQLGVIGTTTAALNGARADVRSRETNLGRLAADSTLWFARNYVADKGLGVPVDIALKNGGGIRATIDGPNITRLAIGAALAFNNKLAIVEMNAAELIATFENAVSRNPALDGRFPQTAGIFLEFDPDQPGASDQESMTTPSRLKTLIVTREDGSEDVVVENNAAVGNLGRTFSLATNSFLLTGGDGYRSLAAINNNASRSVISPDLGEQQILEDYIAIALGGAVDLPEPLDNLRVNIAPIAPPIASLTGFEKWATTQFPQDAENTGKMEDYDGDGEANIMAYAFASNERNRPMLTLGSNNNFLMTCTIVDDPDLTCVFQRSSDFENWNSLEDGVDYEVVTIDSPGSGILRMTVSFPRGNSGSSFFRMQFE